MRRVIEQQSGHLAGAHHLQQLHLIVGRLAELRAREIPVPVSEKQLRRPVFIGDSLADRREDFLRQLPTVVEIPGGNLDRPLMVVRSQQHKVGRWDPQFPFHPLAQNGRRYIQAVEIVVDEDDSPGAIVQRQHARVQPCVRHWRIRLVAAGAQPRPVRRDIDLRRPRLQLYRARKRGHRRRRGQPHKLPPLHRSNVAQGQAAFAGTAAFRHTTRVEALFLR